MVNNMNTHLCLSFTNYFLQVVSRQEHFVISFASRFADWRQYISRWWNPKLDSLWNRGDVKKKQTMGQQFGGTMRIQSGWINEWENWYFIRKMRGKRSRDNWYAAMRWQQEATQTVSYFCRHLLVIVTDKFRWTICQLYPALLSDSNCTMLEGVIIPSKTEVIATLQRWLHDLMVDT